MQTHEENRKQATDNILSSGCCKKLIVAGPGAGKTFIFTKLLEKMTSDRDEHLVLTFINTLKEDLDSSLSHLAKVYTLHGYCNYLLHNRHPLRRGLTENYIYYPSLGSLINSDWKIIKAEQEPKFIKMMRELANNEEVSFYLNRGNFYDSTAFDDSVYRVNKILDENPEHTDLFKLILIDEFQDFNPLEASFIEKLAVNSPIVIAGDDDQALYSILRSASYDFIRSLYQGQEYDNFELPYCMRCTQVIINAFNNIVSKAQSLGFLQNRISKRYLFYPPSKLSDSQSYPNITVAECTVQSKSCNYFNKFITQCIDQIPQSEIEESNSKGFPTALIIGPKHYLDQAGLGLLEDSYNIIKKDKEDISVKREDGLLYLKNNPESNLGWRIVIEVDNPSWRDAIVQESHNSGASLVSLIPDDYKKNIIQESTTFSVNASNTASHEIDTSKPTIQLTSYEGAKGLSAQHVFILGLQENELPRNTSLIADIEICKFLVALTRARKKCYILTTSRFGGKLTRKSIFISWINANLKQVINVDRRYWL